MKDTLENAEKIQTSFLKLQIDHKQLFEENKKVLF